jgi:hypothetical protein
MDVARARTKDPEEWLEQAADFSRSMVVELRDWIFRTAPDLTESIKWNVLCYSGRKLVCGLSACKKHVAITFFRGTELGDPGGLFDPNGEGNTSIRTVRVTSLAKLNRRALAELLLAAVDLDAQRDVPLPPKMKREALPMPKFFAEALKKHKKAAGFFASLAPTYQREYLQWLSSAKREETRNQRLQQTLRALAAGHKWIDRKKP